MLKRVDHQELQSIRQALGITQDQMAHVMGMPLRTYQMIEVGNTAVKPWHLKAARYGAIDFVSRLGNRDLAKVLPSDLVWACTEIARLATEADPGP